MSKLLTEKNTTESTKITNQQRSPSTIPDWLKRISIAITSEHDAIEEYDSILASVGFPNELKEAIEEVRNDEKDHAVKLSAIVDRYSQYKFPNNTKELSELPDPLKKSANHTLLLIEKLAESEHQEWLKEKEIEPFKRTPTSTVGSYGKSKKDGKWYGWSHRARYGFGIGDTVKEGDSEVGFDGIKPGFKCKTDNDCKRVAKAFSESVS